MSLHCASAIVIFLCVCVLLACCMSQKAWTNLQLCYEGNTEYAIPLSAMQENGFRKIRWLPQSVIQDIPTFPYVPFEKFFLRIWKGTKISLALEFSSSPYVNDHGTQVRGEMVCPGTGITLFTVTFRYCTKGCSWHFSRAVHSSAVISIERKLCAQWYLYYW